MWLEGSPSVGPPSFPRWPSDERCELRSSLGALDPATLASARAACNPCEQLGRAGFVCRSALKLANLDALCDFELCSGTFVDVCAAPGGFSEYLVFRGATGFAMSLAGENSDGVGLDRRVSSVQWVDGDGTGDIYKRANADELARRAFPASLVVADGGFDACRDVDDQDAALGRLAVCETAVAIASLGHNGNFVLKLFLPLACAATCAVLATAHVLFSRLALVKPDASRPASGEVYLVALGFRAIDAALRQQCVDALRDFADDPEKALTDEDASLARCRDYLSTRRSELLAKQAQACRDILDHASRKRPARTCDVASYAARWRLPAGVLPPPKKRR